MINPYVGEVTLFAFKFAPVGWVKCDGALLSVTEFSQLFAVIGTKFGGDGIADFGVPYYQSLEEDTGFYCMSLFGLAPTGKRNALPGELTILPYNPPPGWINCNGQTVLISQYRPLFEIVGTAFGGDGVNTFGVPDMRLIPPGDHPPNSSQPKPGGTAPPSIYSIADVPSGSTDQGFAGEVKIFPSTAAPQGWVPCDGRVLSIDNPNTALFSLIGTSYGGDGTTNFAVPNLSQIPKGLTFFICVIGVYPQSPPAET
jgi:microcystin-dependent protein